MYFLCILPGDFQVVRLLYQRSTKTSLAIQSRIAVTEWLHQLSTASVLFLVFSTLRSAMAIRCCWRNWAIPMWRCSGSMGYMPWKSFCREPKGLRNRKCTMATHVLFRDFAQDSGSLNWWLVRSFDSRRFRSPIGVLPHVGVLYCLVLESEPLFFNLDSWPRWWLCYYIVFLFWTTQLSLQHDCIFLQ